MNIHVRHTRAELERMLVAAIRAGEHKDTLRSIWMSYAQLCTSTPRPLFSWIQRECLNGRVRP